MKRLWFIWELDSCSQRKASRHLQGRWKHGGWLGEDFKRWTSNIMEGKVYDYSPRTIDPLSACRLFREQEWASRVAVRGGAACGSKELASFEGSQTRPHTLRRSTTPLSNLYISWLNPCRLMNEKTFAHKREHQKLPLQESPSISLLYP
jgi:hypothetical protein